MTREDQRKLRSKVWWAAVRGPSLLPVLFQDRRQAMSEMDVDEYLVRVRVEAVNVKERAQ